MKKLLTLVVLCSAYLFPQTNDLNITGAGARAEGFGGAFIGLADDATAVVWNPAGLSQLERPEASIVTRFKGESADFSNSIDPSLDAKESQSNFSLNFGSLALPVSSGDMKIVVAAAFQRQLDFYESQQRQVEMPGTGIFSPNYIESQRSETHGGVNTITPAVGIRFNPMISFGLSTNIWIGSLTATDQLHDSRVVVHDEDTYDLKYSGLNFVFGGLLDFEGVKNGIPLKVGLTFRTPFKLKATGTYNMVRRIASNGTAQFDIEQEIEMPFMFGMGTSYRIGENLTVAMDYEIRNYGTKSITSTATHQATGLTGTNVEDISESKQNLNEFRIGAEYLIVTDNFVIPVRGGFKTVPSVFADYVYDNTTGSYVPTSTQTSGTGFSVGTGYIANAFAIDVTYSRSGYTQKFDTDGKIDYGFGTVGSSIIIYF
ncbi:MAG: OmpP1/FadL family transporter [Bacteroidota bacterium]